MDHAPGTERESALLWALRLFGLARPKQPPPPPSIRVISLYALAAVLGLVLLAAGDMAGFVLLVPSAVMALKSWRNRRSASASDPH